MFHDWWNKLYHRVMWRSLFGEYCTHSGIRVYPKYLGVREVWREAHEYRRWVNSTHLEISENGESYLLMSRVPYRSKVYLAMSPHEEYLSGLWELMGSLPGASCQIVRTSQ